MSRQSLESLARSGTHSCVGAVSCASYGVRGKGRKELQGKERTMDGLQNRLGPRSPKERLQSHIKHNSHHPHGTAKFTRITSVPLGLLARGIVSDICSSVTRSKSSSPQSSQAAARIIKPKSRSIFHSVRFWRSSRAPEGFTRCRDGLYGRAKHSWPALEHSSAKSCGNAHEMPLFHCKWTPVLIHD